MGFRLYFSNLGMFLNTVALIVIPAAVIGMLIQMAIVPGSTQVEEGTLVFEDNEALGAFVGGSVITTLLLLFVTLLATAAITKAVADQYLGRKPTISDSLSFARGKWGGLLRLGILEGLILIVAFLALIIPGIYLVVAFAVAGPVLLLEGMNARDSLGQSRSLVKGRWWPVLGVLLLSMLVNFLLGSILGLLLQPVLQGVETVRTQILVSSVGDMIVQILAAPLGAAITVVLYFDLRARKEGFGLREIEALTASGSAGGPGTLTTKTPEPPSS